MIERNENPSRTYSVERSIAVAFVSTLSCPECFFFSEAEKTMTAMADL